MNVIKRVANINPLLVLFYPRAEHADGQRRVTRLDNVREGSAPPPYRAPPPISAS